MSSRVIKQKIAFTADNLAIIGALDDFYEVYCQVSDICRDLKNKYRLQHKGEDEILFRAYFMLDYNKKEIRRACEPLVNKYLYLFTDTRTVFYAREFGFRAFVFHDIIRPTGAYTKDYRLKEISFDAFLLELEIAVARTFANWNLSETKDTYSSEEFEKEYQKVFWTTNSRIQRFVETKGSAYGSVPDAKTSNATKEVLYIFNRLSSVLCYREKHHIDTKALCTEGANGERILLPVHYCNECGKYFIGRITLSLFEKKYGKIIALKRKLEDCSNQFDAYNSESKLHQLGYNVIDGILSEKERQKLLIQLIEQKYISYLEVTATIEQDIRMFESSDRHAKAVEKWKRDLKFIGNYVAENAVSEK